jgi:hypothetical protein
VFVTEGAGDTDGNTSWIVLVDGEGDADPVGVKHIVFEGDCEKHIDDDGVVDGVGNTSWTVVDGVGDIHIELDGDGDGNTSPIVVVGVHDGVSIPPAIVWSTRRISKANMP